MTDVLEPDDTTAPARPRGRIRRTFSDLYHERTAYRFIAYSRRWFVLSLTLLVVSGVALGVRGLNLGIEFKGGTSWQVPVKGFPPSIDQVRTVLSDAGLPDARVTLLKPARAGDLEQIRVESKVQHDPTSQIRSLVATAARGSEADVRVERRGDGGIWTVTTKAKVDTQRLQRQVDAVADVRNPKVDQRGSTVMVTLDRIPAGPVVKVADALARYARAQPDDVSIDTVGPIWGHRVTERAIRALIAFFLVVAIYLSARFEWKMAVAALVAVGHDMIIAVGAYAIFQFAVTPATVTAFLTILGYSLYDTVVVFDKVREHGESLLATGHSTYSDMVNKSLNEVLMRSISTSIVALMPVGSLLIVGSAWLGATALEDFALALFVGLAVGTYSSIFVATPIVAWWKEREPRYADLRARLASQAARRGSAGAPRRPARTAAPAGTAAATATATATEARRAPDDDSEALKIARAVQARARQQRRKKRR
jgi:preprotein translocase subunit SecF